MPFRPKRRYWVVKRRQRDDLPEVFGKKFGKHNAFTIGDLALARDIDQKYGRYARGPDAASVLVLPVADRSAQRQEGYKVYFSVPEMPWRRKKGKDNG